MYNKSVYDSADKKDLQAKEQIFHNFVTILEEFPQYKVSQHLIHILRKKSEITEPYFWSNDLLLKKFEQYLDELRTEISLDETITKEED